MALSDCIRYKEGWKVKFAMKKNGFSLVEVVASFVIVGLAIIGVMQMFAMDAFTSVLREDSLAVVNLMRQKVEELKFKPFKEDVTDVSGTSSTGFEDYVFTVEQINEWEGNPFLKKIEVTATWNSFKGTQRQEEVSFLKADY